MRAPQKVMNAHRCLAQKIYYQMTVGLLRRYFKQPAAWSNMLLVLRFKRS